MRLESNTEYLNVGNDIQDNNDTPNPKNSLWLLSKVLRENGKSENEIERIVTRLEWIQELSKESYDYLDKQITLISEDLCKALFTKEFFWLDQDKKKKNNKKGKSKELDEWKNLFWQVVISPHIQNLTRKKCDIVSALRYKDWDLTEDKLISLFTKRSIDNLKFS